MPGVMKKVDIVAAVMVAVAAEERRVVAVWVLPVMKEVPVPASQ